MNSMRENRTLKTRVAISAAIVIFVILVCTSVVSGVITGADKISPAGTYIGNDYVSINIKGLLPGGNEKVNISFTSTNLQPTATPAIQMTSFPMPFAFVNGWTNISGTNVNKVYLEVKEQGGNNPSQESPPPLNTQYLVKKETYQLIKFSGTPAGAGVVGLTIWMNGTTAAGATDPANLKFTPQGVSSGTLTIGVYNGNTYVNSWNLIIGSAPPPDYGSESSGYAPSGPAAAPAAVAAPAGQQQVTMLIAKEGQTLETYSVSTPTEATVDATVTVEQGTTITDPAGNFVNTVSIEQVSVQDVPSMEGAGFAFAGVAVECGPEGATFSEPASVTFSLTQAQWDLALAQANGNPSLMEIQYYDKVTQSWVGVPTTVDILTHEVTALVDHFSLFALVIIQAPPAAPVAEITAAGVSPVLTRETTPLIARPPVTTPKPTPAPFVSIPAMIGVLVVAGLAYTLTRKK
jgi:hypothetical protein